MAFGKQKNRSKNRHKRKRTPLIKQPSEARQSADLSQLSFIKTEEDIEFFVRAIGDLWSEKHTKDTDDFVSVLPLECHQLIWLIMSYVKEMVTPSEQTIDSMLKLLAVCSPESKRCDKSAFDILIEDCDQELIKERYEYFRCSVFGIHSNCYRETVSLCIDALLEVDPKAIVEAFEKAKNAQQKEDPKSNSEKPLFGQLAKYTGQDYQVEQHEKYADAIHESSHAVASYLLGLDFSGVSIISTDKVAGRVRRKNSSRREAWEAAICSYAGAAGEMAVLNLNFQSMFFCKSDMRNATEVIKNEVQQELSNPQDAFKYVFIDADALGLADKESPYIIYETIRRCVELRQQAIDLIAANKEMVAALAQELLEKRYLPSEEVIEFLDDWRNKHYKVTEEG